MSEENELFDAAFATRDYEPETPPRRDFKPWHRPRKQYVREFQWLECATRVFNSLPVERPLEYLGLPGEDLLDIRLLQQEFCPDRALRYFGFNTDPGAVALISATQQVRHLAGIHEDSHVSGDDFRALSDRDSVAFQNAKDRAPFDLVNLDLCASILKDDIGGRSLYTAMVNLLFLQRARNEPWLLLITTRVDEAGVAADAVERLDDSVQGNRDACDGFDDRYVSQLSGNEGSLAACADADRTYVFAVALTKWILTAGSPYHCAVELQSSMTYRIDPSGTYDDMLSIAMIITPPAGPATDPSGLTNAADLVPYDECSWAVGIPATASAAVAVDAELAGDPTLATRMKGSSAKLLEAAGYDISSYDAYAESYDADAGVG